jgi:hypothetical protein
MPPKIRLFFNIKAPPKRKLHRAIDPNAARLAPGYISERGLLRIDNLSYPDYPTYALKQTPTATHILAGKTLPPGSPFQKETRPKGKTGV